jgi:hypothetical protein
VYDSYQLPLHFKAGVNSDYHLVFEGIDGFYPNSEIYLEDVFLDKIIDLREQQIYNFQAGTGDENNRFILHFYGVTSTGENPMQNNTTIFASGKTVYVKSAQLPKSASRVEVFNVMGQMVYTSKLAPSSLNSFSLNEKTGIYIVRVHTEKGMVVQKLMIQ